MIDIVREHIFVIMFMLLFIGLQFAYFTYILRRIIKTETERALREIK